MKNLILIFVLFFNILNAQTYTLRTYGIEYPKDSYIKDTENELPSYEGNWVAFWDNKIIILTLKKSIKYQQNFARNQHFIDLLFGRYVVKDMLTGQVYYDTTKYSDLYAPIEGSKFRKKTGKYGLSFYDANLCGIMGSIDIQFTDSNKNKLDWSYNQTIRPIITTDCSFYNKLFIEPLPKKAIFVKQ